jgi:predicted ATPase/DNA-binding CsgD family transcriptional regulator
MEIPAGDLTIALTSFVGRRREITDVRRKLSESRLVTLTGVGGVGKTRLAVEVANASRRAFGSRVWLVDVSAVEDGAQVPEAVASGLGVVDRSTLPLLDKLVGHLADQRGLIVLDNCEHLLADCAALVAEVLRRTERVQVLATSRQTLGITGEHLFTVPPLPVPDLQHVPAPEDLGQCDSVRLLLDRAAALRPGFVITEHNRIAAARLCVQLDGLPLAIELAAARLRSLSLEQLVDRLGTRFALLTVGSRGAQPRQQTLRALVDWSYSLCSVEERLLWARLSVFFGPFDLAAAEGVCAGDGLAGAAVLDLLDRLVSQSIVVSETHRDQVTFRLLETIRQYGRERLVELGQESQLRHRHRDYYLGLVERIAREWCGPAQVAGLESLRSHHGNLRAALDMSVNGSDGAGPALRLTVALRHHWYVDGFLGEGRRWLDQALALAGQVPRLRVGTLWVAAWVALLQGDHEAGGRRLAECEALAAELGDQSALGFTTSLRGTAELFQGNLPSAIEHFEAALAIFDGLGGTEGALWARFQLAIALSHLGDSRAAAICRQSIAISEQCGELLCRSYALWVLGFDTWRCGDPAQALALAREGLSIQREFRDPIGAGLMIELIAWITASAADPALAARYLGAAESVWADIGTALAVFQPRLAEHRADSERRIRSDLTEQELRAAVREGRQPGTAAAISYVLADGATAADPASENGVTLTPRERTIADLVAEGLTNRAIAADLVISVRTVDGHVERTLAKLGFTSRAQVAGWVAAQRNR